MSKNAKSDTVYKMIEFKEKTKKGCKIIECVPSSWITYDHKLGSCVVQYMNPPYSIEDSKLIQDLIKNRAQPPQSWPQFPVNLRGDANSYKEGMSKLNILEVQPYTTDSESRGMEKAKKTEEMFKSRADVEKMLSKEDESSSELSSTNTSSSGIQNTQTRKNNRIEESDESLTNYNKSKQNIEIKKKKVITRNKLPKSQKESTKQQKKTNKPSISNTSNLRKYNNKITDNQFNATANINQEQVSDASVLPDDELSVDVSEISEDASLKNVAKTLTFIYVAIKKMTIEINFMKNDIQELRSSIERLMCVKNDQISIPAFVEKYNFIKIQSIEDFKKFDSELKTNDEFAKDFKDVLVHLIGSNVKQSIISVVKKFLHREFAMKCTAIKQSNNKFVLKNTYFYNSLFDLICRFHKNSDGGTITEKIFYQSLSSCLTNAKDWDGYRKIEQDQYKKKMSSNFSYFFVFSS